MKNEAGRAPSREEEVEEHPEVLIGFLAENLGPRSQEK